jgi:hypothetical protein
MTAKIFILYFAGLGGMYWPAAQFSRKMTMWITDGQIINKYVNFVHMFERVHIAEILWVM